MKLQVVSWNIRHFRLDKIQDYALTIIDETAAAHVAFFYESKEKTSSSTDMVNAMVKMLKRGINKSWYAHPEYSVDAVDVGTGENVIFFCSTRTKPSKNPHGGVIAPYDIDYVVRYDLMRGLFDAGKEALSHSYNETVMAERASKKLKFRIPLIVTLTITRPDKAANETITIAAWHAPGPAKGTAPTLFRHYAALLAPHVDVFVGDFNFVGTTPSDRLGIDLLSTGQSTTFTESGLVKRTDGFDHAYRNLNTIAPDQPAFAKKAQPYKAWAEANASLIERMPTWQKAFEMTDHLPVTVALRGIFR